MFFRKEFKPPKTRIEKITKKNGRIEYFPQYRFLWDWNNIDRRCYTLEDAQKDIDLFIDICEKEFYDEVSKVEHIKYP